MDEKAMKQFVADAINEATAPLKSELEEVRQERDELKFKVEQHDKEKAEFEARQRKQKIVATRKEVNDLLNRAVREKHMTPAMREIYADPIGVMDDDRVLDIEIDKVRKMCSVEKAQHDESEDGRSGGRKPEGDPSEELTTKTFEYMAEHNEGNFTRALSSVIRMNPDLHRDYLNSNREG